MSLRDWFGAPRELAVYDRREPVIARPQANRSPENPAVSIESAVSFLMDGLPSVTGQNITERRAIQLAAVYACVRVISQAIGTLPLKVYRRGEGVGDSVEAVTHPLYRKLHDEPNAYQTSAYWREVEVAKHLLWGNAYSLIDMNRGGQVLGLHPLDPTRTTPRLVGRQVIYDHILPDGKKETLPAAEVLHVPGLGFDGVAGMSVIRNARNTMGLAAATEEYGGRFFANDARPGIVFELPPGKTTPERRQELGEEIEQKHQGLGRSHRAMVLENGAKLHEVGIPPEDAQFLETRKFQRSEIAGIYGVPPHMIGDLDHATFSNIEHQAIAFVQSCIRPWCVRWEQEINRKLLGVGFYAEFNLDGLLRGDFASRMDGYSKGVVGGVFTPNEARALENKPPKPGGDALRVPINTAPADSPAGRGETKAATAAADNGGSNAGGQQNTV